MILSVPHTGTHFLQGLVGHLYSHTFESDEDIQIQLNACRHGGVLSPLRDPQAVYESWHARSGTGFAVQHSMQRCWERLAELDEKLDIFYFPIDVDREHHLERLSAHVGRPLTTNWEKVNSYPAKEAAPPKDLGWIYDLPMVKRYYTC